MARSVAELRRECEDARSDLEQTLAELKARATSAGRDVRRKISPEGVKAELSEKSRAWGRDVKRYIETNPLQSIAAGFAIAVPVLRLLRAIPPPVALIGMGFALSLRPVRDSIGNALGPTVEQAKQSATDFAQSASDALGKASDTIADTAANVREGAEQTVSGAAEALKESGERVGFAGLAPETVKQARDFVGDYAAVLGGLGVLLGGAIASALPSAKVEQNAMGTIRRQAATASGALIDSAGERLRAANEASVQAVEESHLSEAASDKIQSLAETARAAVSKAIDAGLNPNSGEDAHG